MINMSKFQTNN